MRLIATANDARESQAAQMYRKFVTRELLEAARVKYVTCFIASKHLISKCTTNLRITKSVICLSIYLHAPFLLCLSVLRTFRSAWSQYGNPGHRGSIHSYLFVNYSIRYARMLTAF